jgi:hypothetical protein
MPARDEIPTSLGMVTSIGSHGATSSPWSHAAVNPEKAAASGKRLHAAASRELVVSRTPDQT